MSVISSYRTKIRLAPERLVDGELDPTWRIMTDALETTAQEYGGRVTGHITDYYGRQTRCQFALVTPDFPRGVGIRVGSGGEVTYIYDNYGGYQRVAAQISERITQNYTALAVSRALEELNYSVEFEEHEEEVPASVGRRRRAVVVRGSL